MITNEQSLTIETSNSKVGGLKISMIFYVLKFLTKEEQFDEL